MLNHLRTLNSSTIVPLAATNTIQLTATLQIAPLFDIQHEDVAHAYGEGLRSRLQTGQGPFAASYLVNFLHSANERNWFDQRHEAQLRRSVGLIFGEIHGEVLTPNGTRLPDVTSLVTLNQKDEQRGYRAGRLWFYYEATPDERTLTDNELLKRLHEYVTDSHMWGDPDGVWSYTVACLLGELSGHLFPLTAREQQVWEAEYRYWHEKLDRQ
jgi:hypothetical protein